MRDRHEGARPARWTGRPVVVLGLMGAGKTSVGTLLAARLPRPVRDSDADLEARYGLTAARLADRYGRGHLHELEARHLLDAVRERPPAVVCAAASVVDRSECRDALEKAFVVWLDAPPDVLAGRFASAPHRPRYDEDIAAMLTEQDVRRRPGMAAAADLVVDVSSCAPEDVVRTIVERVS